MRKIILSLIFSSLLLSMVPAMAQTFSDPPHRNISETSGAHSDIPSIDANDDGLYIVWNDDGDIFFTKGINGGNNFNYIPKVIATNVGITVFPSVSADGKNIYVAWDDAGDIYFAKSTNGGVSFSASTDLILGDDVGQSNPVIITSGLNTVYIIWYDAENIYFAKSIDGGHYFSDPNNLSKSGNVVSGISSMITDGANIYVSWVDDSDGPAHIFFTKSMNRGNTFDPSKKISDSGGIFSNPSIATDGTIIYAVWNELGGGMRFTTSINGGDYFVPSKDISSHNNVGQFSKPAIITGGPNIVYVTWDDYAGVGYDPDTNIFFTTSINGGRDFSPIQNSIDGTPNTLSMNPTVAIDGINIYVVWQDNYFEADGEILISSATAPACVRTVITPLVTLVSSPSENPQFRDLINSISYPVADAFTPYFMDVATIPQPLVHSTLFEIVDCTGMFLDNVSKLSVADTQALGFGSGQYWFPYGLFSWNATVPNFGESITVEITHPTDFPPRYHYLHRVDHNHANAHWVSTLSISPDPPLTSLSGKIATVTIFDGGSGDADGMVDGKVWHIGGVAVPDVPVHISNPISPKIPDNIKNNIKLWAYEKIDDVSFTQGIKSLIQKDIMTVKENPKVNDVPKTDESAQQKIPSWIKQNAKWWTDGMITEQEFVDGLEYLIGQKIVRVN